MLLLVSPSLVGGWWEREHKYFGYVPLCCRCYQRHATSMKWLCQLIRSAHPLLSTSFILLPIGCRAPHPPRRSSPEAHGSSEHKHVRPSKIFGERDNTESCEVYPELQVWKGHVVHQRFWKVLLPRNGSSPPILLFLSLLAPPLHVSSTVSLRPQTAIWCANSLLRE